MTWGGTNGAQADALPRTLEAERAALRGVSVEERARLAPMLSSGVVGLVEFSREAELPAVLVAMRVAAPPSVLADALGEPARWPRFLPAVDAVEVERRDPRGTAFRWTWRLGPFTFRGRNVLRRRRLRDGTESFSVRALEGDLGRGRMRWWLHPAREGGSVLVLASRVDLREANYVTRQLTAGGNGINRSINVAMAFVMALAVAEEGCRRQGREGDACWPLTGRGEEDVLTDGAGMPLLRLEPLLARGDLLLVRLGPRRRLDSVSVLARMGRRSSVVRSVLRDPEAFGSALVRGSRAEVVSRGPEGIRFAWSVPLPLVGASGELLVREEDGARFTVRGTRGALAGGRWRFEVEALPWHEGVLRGEGRFDPGDVSWLLRALCNGIRWFEHGLAAASQVMVARSVRLRARYRWR